jgi:hypothetical protein
VALHDPANVRKTDADALELAFTCFKSSRSARTLPSSPNTS